MKQYDIAITCGVFDMLHEGHADLFGKMREMAKCVVAMVHDDMSTWKNKKRMPVQLAMVRRDNVRDTGLADVALIVKEQNPAMAILDAIKLMRVNHGERVIYVRGDDWKDFPGRKELESNGVEILFKKYYPGISSSERRRGL
jgi:cytidyltransferase-like protein